MKPASLDLEIYKGDTCEVFFRLRNKLPDGTAGDYINLTGAVAKSQIRETATATDVVAEFTASIGDQVASPGSVLLTLTPAQTGAITVTKGVWDVQVQNASGEVNTYLAGKVTFIEEVTRT